ncbi:MAG: D-alanine--poly(phosphoribitol) ligase, partial [Gemmatimonadetes bacterium]|nr:D-alanine--poly(phosphoribitol) ligase [Gemmatimonadota bacterium]
MAMDHIDWQLGRFRDGADAPAIVWRDRPHAYAELTARYREWLGRLRQADVRRGDAVAVVSDFSPGAVACLLAL